MEKYLATIEFRYLDAPDKHDSTCRNKELTIGVYGSFEEACVDSNGVLEYLESVFKLHKFPGGIEAKRERFSKNGGCFGGKNTLVSNLAYLATPFSFYAKISTLKYSPINETIDEVVNSVKRYHKFKRLSNQ